MTAVAIHHNSWWWLAGGAWAPYPSPYTDEERCYDYLGDLESDEWKSLLETATELDRQFGQFPVSASDHHDTEGLSEALLDELLDITRGLRQFCGWG